MAVARARGLIVGVDVVEERSLPGMQQLVDRLPPAQRDCTAACNIYDELIWPPTSIHVMSIQKAEPYTIASVNANVRTYLKRLARRSRCCSRCIKALRRASRLFVWYYNRRQRLLLAHPHYRNPLPLLF